jgi:hypothetical protein
MIYLGTIKRCVVRFTLRPLYPREKKPRYPADRRLSGLRNRSGRSEEKITLPLLGIKTLSSRGQSNPTYIRSKRKKYGKEDSLFDIVLKVTQ